MDSPLSVAESIELPRERAPGTLNSPPLLQAVTGELTLCGLVGRLAFESKELALCSSWVGCLVWVGETLSAVEWVEVLLLSWTGAADVPMFASLVADVSIVMVGARGRSGPPSLSSAAMVAWERRRQGWGWAVLSKWCCAA